jgi:hypothetical protein
MHNPDHISESLETIFWVTDPDPGSEIFFNLPDGKNSDPV